MVTIMLVVSYSLRSILLICQLFNFSLSQIVCPILEDQERNPIKIIFYPSTNFFHLGIVLLGGKLLLQRINNGIGMEPIDNRSSVVLI